MVGRIFRVKTKLSNGQDAGDLPKISSTSSPPLEVEMDISFLDKKSCFSPQ